MAQFPKSEAETVALIQEMINGLANNAAIYPSPPVSTAALSGVLSGYLSAKTSATDAQAKAEQKIALKNEALQAMIDDMKQDLRYAENTVNYDDPKLKLIGWGGRGSSGDSVLNYASQRSTPRMICNNKAHVYAGW